MKITGIDRAPAVAAPSDRKALGLLESGGASLIFGFSYLFCSVGFRYVSPNVFLCLRFVLAFLVFCVLALFRVVRISLRGKPVGKLFLIGLLYPVLGFICDNYGTYYSSSAFAGSIVAITPVVMMVTSVLLLHSRIDRRQVLCAVTAVLGALLLSFGDFGSQVSMKGLLLMIGAVLTNALFTVLSKKYAAIFTAAEKTFVQLAMAAVFFTAMALPSFFRGEVEVQSLAQPQLWLSVVYLVVLASIASFFLLNSSIRYITPTQSAIMSSLVPVTSVTAGVFILHDSFSLMQLLGVTIIILSVYGASRSE